MRPRRSGIRSRLFLCRAADIADKADTTLETLTLWLARPDIAQRITNLSSALALRTRLQAAAILPSVVQMLGGIVSSHEAEESRVPVNPDSGWHRSPTGEG